MIPPVDSAPVDEIVDEAVERIYCHLQERVHEQRELWTLIPALIRTAEAHGIRLDHKTRFSRSWKSRDQGVNGVVDRHVDTCPEFSEDFWYVGKGGQGTVGQIGISLENGDFVMVGSEGPVRRDFPKHLLVENARNYPESFEAEQALQDVARAIGRVHADSK